MHFKVNIGLPFLKLSRAEEFRQRKEQLKNLKVNSASNESEIPLGEVKNEWLKTTGPYHIKTIVEHFNIFRDLYGEAYFIPRVPLKIAYSDTADTSTPVYFGNQIKPNEVNDSHALSYHFL